MSAVPPAGYGTTILTVLAVCDHAPVSPRRIKRAPATTRWGDRRLGRFMMMPPKCVVSTAYQRRSHPQGRETAVGWPWSGSSRTAGGSSRPRKPTGSSTRKRPARPSSCRPDVTRSGHCFCWLLLRTRATRRQRGQTSRAGGDNRDALAGAAGHPDGGRIRAGLVSYLPSRAWFRPSASDV